MHVFFIKLIVCFFYRLNTSLEKLEKQHCIPHRWVPADTEYIQVQQYYSQEKQDQLAEAMWTSSVCRQFLLKLKSKYAGISVFVELNLFF